MADVAVEFLARFAVTLPVVLITSAGLWLAFNRRRLATSASSFTPSDMRTWSLRFSLIDGAVFAFAFALLSAVMVESPFSAGVAGGVSALVALGLMPRLAARYPRLAKK
jgi:hypothetical protein